MMFNPLATLNKSKTTWRIKVRVMHMWPTQSTVSKGLSGYNLILCDDDVSIYTYNIIYYYCIQC